MCETVRVTHRLFSFQCGQPLRAVPSASLTSVVVGLGAAGSRGFYYLWKKTKGLAKLGQEEQSEKLQAKPSIYDRGRSPLFLEVQREAQPEEEELQAKLKRILNAF